MEHRDKMMLPLYLAAFVIGLDNPYPINVIQPVFVGILFPLRFGKCFFKKKPRTNV